MSISNFAVQEKKPVNLVKPKMLYQILIVGLFSLNSVRCGKITEKPNLNRVGKGKLCVHGPLVMLISISIFQCSAYLVLYNSKTMDVQVR